MFNSKKQKTNNQPTAATSSTATISSILTPAADEYDLLKGWNNLTDIINQGFEKIRKDFENRIFKNTDKGEILELWNTEMSIRNWYRGEVVIDPTNNISSAIQSNSELLNGFFMFIKHEQLEIAHDIWLASRIQPILLQCNQQRIQSDIFIKIAYKATKEFCYDFLKNYARENEMFAYLDLINKPAAVKMLSAKLKSSKRDKRTYFLLTKWIEQNRQKRSALTSPENSSLSIPSVSTSHSVSFAEFQTSVDFDSQIMAIHSQNNAANSTLALVTSTLPEKTTTTTTVSSSSAIETPIVTSSSLVPASATFADAEQLKNGWNSLGFIFNSYFENLKTNVLNYIKQQHTQDLSYWQSMTEVRKWYRGEIIIDPNYSNFSAVIGDKELLAFFKQLFKQVNYAIAYDVWKENNRLHEIFKQLTSQEEQRFFLKKVALKNEAAFCYDFLAIYQTKEALLEYLNLIDDAGMVYDLKRLFEFSMKDTFVYESLSEWIQKYAIHLHPSSLNVQQPAQITAPQVVTSVTTLFTPATSQRLQNLNIPADLMQRLITSTRINKKPPN